MPITCTEPPGTFPQKMLLVAIPKNRLRSYCLVDTAVPNMQHSLGCSFRAVT